MIVNIQITIITLEGTAENKGKSFANRLLASANQNKSKPMQAPVLPAQSSGNVWMQLQPSAFWIGLNHCSWEVFSNKTIIKKTCSTILVSRENHEIYCHGTINYKVTIATFSLLLLFASLFALILMQLQCKTLFVLSCDPCLAQRVAMQLYLLRFSIFLSTDIPAGQMQWADMDFVKCFTPARLKKWEWRIFYSSILIKFLVFCAIIYSNMYKVIPSIFWKLLPEFGNFLKKGNVCR